MAFRSAAPVVLVLCGSGSGVLAGIPPAPSARLLMLSALMLCLPSSWCTVCALCGGA